VSISNTTAALAVDDTLESSPRPTLPELARHTGAPVPKEIFSRLMMGLQALNIDVGPALARFNLTPEALPRLAEEELRWSFLYDFWTAVRETTGQYGIGLRLGALVRPEYYEVFGFVLTSSATLGDALLRATRFMRLVAPNIELSFYVEGDRAVLLYKALDAELFHPESSEFVLCAIGTIGRQLTGVHLRPIEVRFAHEAPPDLSHHHAIFENAPIHFNRPHNGYVFESSLLNLPVRSSDGQLCAKLEREAEQLLSRMPRVGELSRRVQETISEELRGGNPSAEHVADKLGMHPKTLSRRLKGEGTSHQQLLDQLRYRLAERYLRDPNLSIGEIAFLLGYSDTSSFNKAFKRWTGAAPQHYRQKTAN
jgi:AraC-like DNA-binding protein